MAIENALRFQRAESSATTDYLTDLPNARSLFLQLDSELSRGRRTNAPLAVCVLDLDGFKMVNDRFGHLEGNRVLHEVAAGLRDCCREYDYVARMGGDEFVVLLPGVRPTDVEAKIATVPRSGGAGMPNLFHESLLSISIGVAHFMIDGNDAEQLLAEADRRMYKEKQTHHPARIGRGDRCGRTGWRRFNRSQTQAEIACATSAVAGFCIAISSRYRLYSRSGRLVWSIVRTRTIQTMPVEHPRQHPDQHQPWADWSEEQTLHVAVCYSNPFRWRTRRELANDCIRHLRTRPTFACT